VGISVQPAERGLGRRGAPPLALENKKAETGTFRPFYEKLAATYSRGVYKTTTIGKTVFDGRVRNGNGSDHSFMATKSAGARLPGTTWQSRSKSTAQI
jgi:hypothetical protein